MAKPNSSTPNPPATGPKRQQVPQQSVPVIQGDPGIFTREWWLYFHEVYAGLGHLQDKAAESSTGGGGPYIRTLLVKDTTVGNDIADRVPIFIASKAVRVLGVLRKAISANLTVRIKLNGTAIATVTIPSATAVGVSVVSATFVNSTLPDKSVLSWDITASDGSKDVNGIASFTVQFN